MSSPTLPETAPFTVEQRQWLNGFLAGLQNFSLFASASAPPTSTDTGMVSGMPVLVLYGSQSGNAEGLAHTFADKLKARAKAGGGAISPRVLGMEHFADVDFTSTKHILMICSTWGEGDMPDNAAAFWEWLKSDKAPTMAHASFAVLGLGDRNYRRFCQGGKNLDGRFAELGAKRLRPLCECDTDFENKSVEWMTTLFMALDADAGTTGVPAERTGIRPDAPTPAPTSGTSTDSTGSPRASSVTGGYNRKNPFPAAMLENRPLNARESAKDTRHLAFSLVGSGLEYKVGDALGIFPRNDFDLADRLILRLNCNGNEQVTLPWGEEGTLRSSLLERLDLKRASKTLLEAILQNARNPGERSRLEKMLAGSEEERNAYLGERDVLDVLDDFSKSRLDPQKIISALGRLTSRLYSIASSPKTFPGEVHLSVGVVRQRIGSRLRRGVASTFLAERVPLGMSVPVFTQASAHFGVPEKSGTPIIMVGPGTGIAPFRAFLQERKQIGDTGKNWLFFGDQKKSFDFLYSDELTSMHNDGFLTKLDLAFSRDQEDKIYVQDRMLQQSKDLFAWLEQGAHFYVCGDAKRMAKDVDAMLHRIIAQEGGMGEDKAKEYVESLKREKRYARDVY